MKKIQIVSIVTVAFLSISICFSALAVNQSDLNKKTNEKNSIQNDIKKERFGFHQSVLCLDHLLLNSDFSSSIKVFMSLNSR